MAGDGRLERFPPRREPSDYWVSRGDSPVPTLGGACYPLPAWVTWGPQDQGAVEDREDVVIYTSSVLVQDLAVVGEVVLQVHVGATARVADFAAKLVDVDPEGRALIVSEGIRRWKAVAATPLAQPLRVRLGGTAHVFRRGHRIRLEIAGSNFPKYDRGPELGPGQTISQWVVHDRDRASFLSLPVVRAWQTQDEGASRALPWPAEQGHYQ